MNGSPSYVIQPLGKQDRAAFHCGEEELDRYFLERASRDVREKLAAVFVLSTTEAPDKVIGYYSLSAVSIDADQIPPALQKRVGRYKRIGATLLGRFAIAREWHGRDLGKLLLLDALRRSLQSSREVGSFAVVVDAKSEKAASFYKQHGFLPLVGRRLFLPMKTIEKLFPSPPA